MTKLQYNRNSDYLISDLEFYCENIKAELRRMRLELSQSPEGSIQARYRKGNIEFSIVTYNVKIDKKTGRKIWKPVHRGITKNTSLVLRMIRKKYICAKIPELEEKVDYISALLESLKGSRKAGKKLDCADFSAKEAATRQVIEWAERYRIDIARMVMGSRDYDWQTSGFRKSEMYPENLIYELLDGRKVRSKAECKIGNLLIEMGIPFRYEPLMEIDGQWISPDFVIRTLDGAEIVLEFMGLLDDPEYREKNFEKLKRYRSEGLILGLNLFVLTNEDLEDNATLKRFIMRAYCGRDVVLV